MALAFFGTLTTARDDDVAAAAAAVLAPGTLAEAVEAFTDNVPPPLLVRDFRLGLLLTEVEEFADNLLEFVLVMIFVELT